MELYNLSELARELKVGRCWLDEKRMRDPRFPKQVAKYQGSRLWTLDQFNGPNGYLKPPEYQIWSVKEAVAELDISYITYNQFRHRKLFPEAVNLDPTKREKHYVAEQMEQMKAVLRALNFHDCEMTKSQRARRKRERDLGIIK